MNRFASNSLAFLGLYDGWEYFDSRTCDGFVAFERHGGVALACGEPVACPDDLEALLGEFGAFCESEGLRPAFASASNDFAQFASEHGWACLKLGEEPWFDAKTYLPRGNRTKKVRSAANQACKGGVTIEALRSGTSPSTAATAAMQEVVEEWRMSRKVKALGFTLRLEPLTLSEQKLTLLAWQNGRLQAFLTCIPIPARNAYSVEDLIRRPTAPNGVSELLLLAAVDACRDRGVQMLTLGLAPLRRAELQAFGQAKAGKILGFVGKHLNMFYDFRALGHFKAKFAPTSWEASYLVYPPGHLGRCVIALILAFTPGRFGALQTFFSRWRIRTAYPLLDRLAAVAGVAFVGVAGAFLAMHSPALAPFALAERDIVRLTLGVGGQAREHLVIDGLLAAGFSALYLRSARSS